MSNTPNFSSGFSSGSSLSSVDESVVGSSASTEKQLFDESIAQLKVQLGEQLAAYSRARVGGDVAGAEAALQAMDLIKRHTAALKDYSQMFEPAVEVSMNTRGAGLTLSHRDLPKFQLANSVIRPFPGCEVFESVEHFLTTFENIVQGSTYRDVEKVWRQFFPLCLPFSESAWVETDLRHCASWSEAREAFTDRHGSSMAQSYFNDQV